MDHTPPPWTVKDETNVMAGKRLVANTGGYQTNVYGSIHVEENRANAQLISATIDLYAACRALIRPEDGHYIECPCSNRPMTGHEYMPHNETVKICKEIQAALAKARES